MPTNSPPGKAKMESAGRTSEFRVEGLDLGKVPQMPFSRLLTSFTERERCVVTGLPPGFTTSGKSAQHDVMRRGVRLLLR